MQRSTLLGAAAVGLAWLVVLAPTAGVAGLAVGTQATDAPASASAAAPLSGTNNSSARLTLPTYRIEQSQFDTVTVGAASTLQAGAFGARETHRRIAVEQDFEAADTVGDQRSVVDRALIAAGNRIQALEARERATVRAYSEGNISSATMVRRLARIDAHARELHDTLDLVRQLTDRIPTDDFDTRFRDLRGLLAPMTGPVRERMARALSGQATPVRVHVVTSDEGLVLSTLAGGEYLREATDWSRRNVSAPSEIGSGDYAGIGERVEELYPWVTTQTRNPSFDWAGSGAWRFKANHDHGELTTLIDASTADVFREVQRLDVDDVPPTTTIVRTSDGLRIVLERTYPGGPLRILVEDASTDAVVNANVSVDGHRLGRIGADGVVMTLEPRLPYTVNVTAGGSSVAVDVDRVQVGS